MRTLPVLLVVLAACGGASHPGSVGNFAGAGGPAGPPPTIAWSGGPPMEGGEFSATGLPAVSDDGSRVIYDWVKGDGGRGYPNLTLVIADRTDRVVDSRVVLDADRVEELDGAVDVTAHNAFLAESNAGARWRPLTRLDVEGEPEGDEMFASKQRAAGPELTVTFGDDAHLVIAQGGKVVVDTVKTAWLVEDRPMYEGAAYDEVCTNPIYLGSVHVDAARKVALIGVEYRGTDTCWEPTGELHVVAW
jgi:hypothetical protein